MKQKIRLRGTNLPVFEQDMKVTVIEERDAPVQPGDTVLVLLRAKVERVYGEGEVDLVNPEPVKVTEVLRTKRSKREKT